MAVPLLQPSIGLVEGLYSTRLTGDFIRVLDLDPGGEGDPIVGHLRCVSLQAAESSYEAISYVWGDPNNTSTIFCNGIEHRITASLSLVLRTVRHATEPLTLWADAICINQSDPEEKEHQVQRMGKVYEGARRVLVYLGPDDEGVAEDCFNLLTNFNQFWDGQLRRYGELRKVPSNPPDRFTVDADKWEMVGKLFLMPWFDRLWVIQEAGLAKECVVYWGNARTNFAEVVELVLWFHCRADIAQQARSKVALKWSDIFLKIQCAPDNTPTWRTDLPLCAWVNNDLARVPENRGSFIEVLRTGRSMKTSNPRDHVYGFLSNPLALTDEGREMVEPNYRKSAEDVYFDTACALLRLHKEAPFLLGAVDHHAATYITNDSDWPSWVPRWDQGEWTYALAVPFNWYDAGGPKELLTAHVLPGRLLSIHCVIFDRLSWVSDTLLEGNLGVDSTKWSGEFQGCGKSPIESLWEELLGACQHASNDLEDRFMTTLCREYPSTQKVKADGIQMSFLRADFAAYRRVMSKAAMPVATHSAAAHLHKSGRAVRFANKISACYNRKLAHTEAGRLVLTSRFAEPNDLCCIFPGVSVPFVVRQSTKDNLYYLIGDSYIYGVMRGEIFQKYEEGKYKRENINLK